MTIIDRYVLKQFLLSFGICYASMFGIYVVFDIFSNMEEFVREADNSSRGLLPIIVTFYAPKLFWFFDKSSAFLVLLASIFTVFSLHRHNELIALMAAGVSRKRLAAPFIIMAVLTATMAAVSQEFIMPKYARELVMTPKDLNVEEGQSMGVREDRETNVLMRGKAFYREEMKIVEPRFQLPRSLDDYGRRLDAEEAVYVPASRGRPGGYLFRGVVEPVELDREPSLLFHDVPVLLTPYDNDEHGFQLESDECFLVSKMDFDLLTSDSNWYLYKPTVFLIQDLRNPSLDYNIKMRAHIHTRIIQPFLDILLLFLGLPLFLQRRPDEDEGFNLLMKRFGSLFSFMGFPSFRLPKFLRGSVEDVYGTLISVTFLIGFYYSVQMVCLSVGMLYAKPALGAWLPLMIFTPIAAILFERLKT
jgi:lipopolysaccharide export system permease protein